MLFPRLMARGRQEFVSLLLPHMPVLHSKALHWTGSRQAADALLDDTLAQLAGNIDEIRHADNLRLLLVSRLYEEHLARREDGGEDLLDKDAIINRFLGEEIWTVSKPN